MPKIRRKKKIFTVARSRVTRQTDRCRRRHTKAARFFCVFSQRRNSSSSSSASPFSFLLLLRLLSIFVAGMSNDVIRDLSLFDVSLGMFFDVNCVNRGGFDDNRKVVSAFGVFSVFGLVSSLLSILSVWNKPDGLAEVVIEEKLRSFRKEIQLDGRRFRLCE